MHVSGGGESLNRYSTKEAIPLFYYRGGCNHFLAVYPSKPCDKTSSAHFYKQSDAIKSSSCLILLSKQDTKKK